MLRHRRRARRRSTKGVELELDVDARGWPAIAAVVGSLSWRRTSQQDLGDQLGRELVALVGDVIREPQP